MATKRNLLFVFILSFFFLQEGFSQNLNRVEKATEAEKILNQYFSSRPYANLIRTEYRSGIMQFNLKNYSKIRTVRSQIVEAYMKDAFSFDTINLYIHNLILQEKSKKIEEEVILTKSNKVNPTVKVPNGPCVNMDFENCNFNGWELFTGSVDANPFGYTNVTAAGSWATYNPANSGSDSHYIVSGAGTDPSVGIPMVNPNGGGCSAIIGDLTTAGYGAASMTQTFMVDANNANFTYYYAVVLEDPNHSAGDQPFFRIRMYDDQGNSVQCAEYDVYPGNGDPAWQINGANFIDWQTAFIPLQSYIGQNVTVEFVVGDCNQSGHWGYAYVDATCEPMEIMTSDTVICGNAITITAPAGASDYQWSNGMSGQTIQVSQAGNYEVTMTAVSGCAIQLDIDIYESLSMPQPLFESDTVCIGNPTSFMDQSTSLNGISTWAWDFDNNGIVDATSNNASYTFPNAGTFTVGLVVTDQQGCSNDTIIDVMIGEQPTAVFTASSVCQGTATTFTDQSIANFGTITAWNWDFQSDGIIDNTTQNPTNGYISAGLYNVTLQVETSGCFSTVTEQVNVNPVPNPNFNWNPVCSGNQMSFADVSSVAGGNIIQWQWDFGSNGATSNLQNPQYIYENAGNYMTQLTVTSDSGCISSFLNNVTVYEHPVANFISSDVCEGLAMSFADVSSTTFGQINSWSWDIDGNGTIDYVNQFPTHTYSTAGTYNPVLIVETDEGCSDTISLSVNVNPLPEIDFTSSDPNGCATWCVDFVNNTTITSGVIENYYWDFGDTYASIDIDPSHCFENNTQEALNFDISLIAISDQGCSASFSYPLMVTVYPIPVAEFIFGPSPTDIYHTEVGFQEETVGSSFYSWDFAGLGSSTTANPSFTFPNDDAGVYEVCLNVINEWGCTDVICHDVVVEGEMLVYVPNAFTPDGDGVNEGFRPVISGHDPDSYNFMIFDRWGLLIYQTDNEYASWDGRYRNSEVSQDAYVWKLVVKDRYKGKQQEFVGHVSVLK